MSGKPARRVLRRKLTLTPRQSMELALDIDHALRTIDSVYAGNPCRASVYNRTVRGAKKLGLPLPPPQHADLDCDRLRVRA